MGDVVAEMCANISSSSDKGSSSYSFNNNEKDNYNKDYNNYDEDDQQHRHRDQNKKRKTNSINTNTMEELERIWSRQVDSPAAEGDDSSFLSSSNTKKMMIARPLRPHLPVVTEYLLRRRRQQMPIQMPIQIQMIMMFIKNVFVTQLN